MKHLAKVTVSKANFFDDLGEWFSDLGNSVQDWFHDIGGDDGKN